MIIVIGAGISGLTVAYYLHRAGVEVQLLEASGRVGGVIQSVEEGGCRVELGPNSLLADDAVREIINEVGLTPQILPPRDVSRHRYIYRGGGYQRLPSNPLSLLFTRFFSFSTKLALFREPFRRSQGPADESVAAFFARRFNQELVDYAVNPFVSGIYAGDPQRLVMAHTFPSVYGFEQRSGSVIGGAMKGGAGAGRRSSFSFVQGMQAIPDQLATELPVVLNTPVEKLERTTDGWRVITSQGNSLASQVVLTVPAHQAAGILAEIDPDAQSVLAAVDYPPLCVVHSRYDRQAVSHPLDGFGGLHPRVENLFSAGSIWSSSLFPGRCGEDQVLFTTFVGGAQYRDHTQLDDATLMARVADELGRLYGISAHPHWQRITRWDKAIPQYDGAMAPVWALATRLESQGLHICTNWRGGVSVADCLKKSRALAQQLVRHKP